MAVYINRGHVPEDGGKPWKHLDTRCPRLSERQKEGYPAERVPNVDDKKPLREHVRRRCPVCFTEGTALDVPTPSWLLAARKLEQSSPATAWTYDLMYPPDLRSQVGMASNLHSRLLKRFRATCQRRFGQDCIPWYHDLLRTDPRVELTLVATPYSTRSEALIAERELRRKKRADGWDVSSDV